MPYQTSYTTQPNEKFELMGKKASTIHLRASQYSGVEWSDF
jgi:hypothetical protein